MFSGHEPRDDCSSDDDDQPALRGLASDLTHSFLQLDLPNDRKFNLTGGGGTFAPAPNSAAKCGRCQQQLLMGTVRLSHIAGSLPVKLCVRCVGALGSKVSNKHRAVDRQYTHNYHRKARSPGCIFRFDAKVGPHIQGIIESYIAQVRADPHSEIDPPSQADLIVAELTLAGKKASRKRARESSQPPATSTPPTPPAAASPAAEPSTAAPSLDGASLAAWQSAALARQSKSSLVGRVFASLWKQPRLS